MPSSPTSAGNFVDALPVMDSTILRVFWQHVFLHVEDNSLLGIQIQCNIPRNIAINKKIYQVNKVIFSHDATKTA